MKSKGRSVLPVQIDHKAQLRERLGQAAFAAAQQQPIFGHGLRWSELETIEREAWSAVADAVLAQIVRGGARGEIEVASIYGYATKQPYVDLWVSTSPSQLSPGKAREIALMLLEAADAAESDAVLAAFAQDALGLGAEGAAQLLGRLREQRERMRGRKVEGA